LSLRSVQSGDGDFLFRLYASTRQEEISSWNWDAQQQAAFLHLQFKAQSLGYSADYPDAAHSLILQDGVPIGRVILHRTERVVRLVDISLLPEHRNRGVGTAIIRDIIAECASLGKPLALQVRKVNPAARLYARLGFTMAGEDEFYIQMRWEPPAKNGHSVPGALPQ
jgi:GNAT superfamily N-acetyltransferase